LLTRRQHYSRPTTALSDAVAERAARGALLSPVSSESSGISSKQSSLDNIFYVSDRMKHLSTYITLLTYLLIYLLPYLL